MTRHIVFTDLDGTLLDHKSYDYTAALPGLKLLKRAGIPLVFCSSKTRAEQEALRRELGIDAPFIVEDGGAIYIKKGYFSFPIEASRDMREYQVIPLGTPYEKIRSVLKTVSRDLALSLRGFGDAPVEEIATATGLSVEAAGRAKRREFEETLLSPLSPDDARGLKEALAPLGLTLSRGGRFYSVKGRHNKGEAAMRLARIFAKQNRQVITIGVGDSPNDLPLLSAVYIPILVQRPDKTWQKMSIAGIKNVPGVGPVGWTRAMEMLFSKNKTRTPNI